MTVTDETFQLSGTFWFSVPDHCYLRVVDAAVVEDEIHAGKLLARLLGFQVKLHHALVT